MKKRVSVAIQQLAIAIWISATGFAQANPAVPSDKRLGEDIIALLRSDPDLGVASIGKHGTVTAVSGVVAKLNKRGGQIRADELAPPLDRVAKLFRVRPPISDTSGLPLTNLGTRTRVFSKQSTEST